MSIFFGTLLPNHLSNNQREFTTAMTDFSWKGKKISLATINSITKQIQPTPDYSIRMVTNFWDFQKLVIGSIMNCKCIYAQSGNLLIYDCFSSKEHALKEAKKDDDAFVIINNGNYNDRTWNIIYIYQS